MDDAEIKRKRDALQSRIDELSEAQRRLIEIEAAAAAAAQIHDAHLGYQENGGGAVPVLASDDDFYAMEEPEDEYHPLLRYYDWHGEEQHHHAVHNQAAAVHDTFGHLQPAPGEETAGSGDHGGGHLLLPDPALYDEGDMVAGGRPYVHVGEATPVRFSDDGSFGGVPASAAAIAGLKKQRYDGGPPGADDDMCVICMRGYKKGKRLYVMPCAYKHRFHRKCLKKWLSRSHLCPLCRHALPTDDDDRAAPRNAIWLLNVN
ncbi:hypothetical protein PVAP13_3NG015000 [Panicum virgatum]|uniref:RING-type domain-containing protein n=1 Tax=Panicum virgatum TaxID=38727 RepID=A0A8T0TS08_PANVG|nr:hypothetical protein PVAP13_3NG015000 [Panicum virgatum]